MKLDVHDAKSLIFGCRDIQGRVRYNVCLSSMPSSGVILKLSTEFISDLSVSAFFSMAMTWACATVEFRAALLQGRSPRLQNCHLNETHGRESLCNVPSNGVKLVKIQYYSEGDLTALTFFLFL